MTIKRKGKIQQMTMKKERVISSAEKSDNASNFSKLKPTLQLTPKTISKNRSNK